MSRRSSAMPRKLTHFEPANIRAMELLARDEHRSFQELVDEAIADLLKKHKRPVTTAEMFRQSLGRKNKPRAR